MKKVYILSAIALFAIALAGVTSAGFMRFGHNPEMFEKKQAFMQESIEQALADGKITQEQADEKMEWMEGMHEKFLNGELECKGFHKGKGFQKGKGFHKGDKFK